MTKEIEKQLIDLHSQGLSNKEISKILICTSNTVTRRLRLLNLKTNNPAKKLNIIDSENAKCSRCNEVKAINKFERIHVNSKYETRISYCSSCRVRQSKTRDKNIEVAMHIRYHNIKSRAKRENIFFSLTKGHISDVYTNQQGKCFYTDIPLNYNDDAVSVEFILSVDKIIPSLGYIDGNIVLCTRRANTIKSNQSLSEMRKWMPNWYKRIKKCEWLTCLQVEEGDF